MDHLTRCRVDPTHLYSSHLPSCDLCAQARVITPTPPHPILAALRARLAGLQGSITRFGLPGRAFAALGVVLVLVFVVRAFGGSSPNSVTPPGGGGQAPFVAPNLPEETKSDTLLICRETGKRANPYCPDPKTQAFPVGTGPAEKCTFHEAPAKVEVCLDTLKKAMPDCPRRETKEFATGTAPTETCDQHVRVDLKICTDSGLLAGKSCPKTAMKIFVKGSEPKTCTLVHKKSPATETADPVAIDPPGPDSTEPPLSEPAPQRVSTESLTLCVDTGMRAGMYCPETVERTFEKGKGPKNRCTAHRPPPVAQEEVVICKDSGQRAGMYCQDTVTRSFPRGQAPSKRCTLHHADDSEATEKVEVCVDSGMRAGMYCPETTTRTFPKGKELKGRCTLHHG